MRDNDKAQAGGTVPLVEERPVIAKRRVETGGLRVRVVTDEEARPVVAELQSDVLGVERVAIGRALSAGEAAPGPREEEGGAVLVIPVLEEVLVVEKRLVLKEELRIRRHVETETVATEVMLRRQRAEVERMSPEPRPTD